MGNGKTIFGLTAALVGLVIVWLWATGRIKAAWSAIQTGNASSALTVPQQNDNGKTGAGSAGSWGTPQSYIPGSYGGEITPQVSFPFNVSNLGSGLLTANFGSMQIPQYITVPPAWSAAPINAPTGLSVIRPNTGAGSDSNGQTFGYTNSLDPNAGNVA